MTWPGDQSVRQKFHSINANVIANAASFRIWHDIGGTQRASSRGGESSDAGSGDGSSLDLPQTPVGRVPVRI